MGADADAPSSFGYGVSDPFEVGRVALLDGQADDLGHLVRMVGAGEKHNHHL